MLTILVGPDNARRANRLGALVASLKKNGVVVETQSDIRFDANELRSRAGSTSLFGGSVAVVISGVADTADRRDELEKILPALAESPHRFIISESALLAPFLKKARASGATVEEFELKFKPKKIEAFNSFLLSDAIYDRKRSVAWPLYRQAIDLGLESRELHGKIFWAVKTMTLAKSSQSAGESGLNPFVFQKAKAGSSNYNAEELSHMLVDLSVLFHEALVSGINLETSLEAFILRALEKRSAPSLSALAITR